MDLGFRLNEAYKTIRNLKEDFDTHKEKCVKIEENYNKIMSEKIEHEISRRNETAETFESAESSRVFIKTAYISSSSALILLLIMVSVLAANILLVIVIIKMKRKANVSKSDETEMGDKNVHDKQ